MVETGQTKMSLFLILMLHFTVPTEQYSPSFVVRVGDDITLLCANMREYLDKCDNITWLFSDSDQTRPVELVKFGQIDKKDEISKSDRLNLTENCDLVIRNVTVQDLGCYSCRQFDKSGQWQGQDNSICLSLINMTKHKDGDEVTLNCSVSTYGKCKHTVKWEYERKDVDENNRDLRMSQSNCSATVSFATSQLIYTPEIYEFLKCEVKDVYNGQLEQFTIRTQPSDQSWWYIILAVSLAVLSLHVVVLITWKKNTRNTSQMDENTADPEDGVNYATISFTKKTIGRAKIGGGDDTVTYSAVRVPSSSADSSSLYATVNKQSK